jgi:hypothetical protein
LPAEPPLTIRRPGLFLMADKTQKPADDSLLNLKFAQAEADLAAKTGGLGPTTNEYVSSDEDDEISRAEGPLDSQGQRRGENDDLVKGDSAGAHS